MITPNAVDKPRPGFLDDCYAVILAGGSGTRLWPLSRSLLPKQLLALDGHQTLLQQTVERVLGAFPAENIWVVTNEEHVFEVRKQIRAMDERLEERILAEPMGRNTLPAVMLALDRIEREDADPKVAVFPSDHIVSDEDRWAATLRTGLELARKGSFVTFGVEPSKPETGYGYIAKGEFLAEGVYRVREFIEKPDLSRAAEFAGDGLHFWNSGMFLFRAKEFLKATARCAPNIWEWWLAREERPLEDGYRTLPDLSLDYGVVEKLEDISVVRADFFWDDVGSWDAIYRRGWKDENGNVIKGDVLATDCRGCLLVSQGGKLAVVGLENMVVIQTRDATLSCPLGAVQRVREVVARLKAEGSRLVESHPTVHRPWGSYHVLEEGAYYKIKRIVVDPGARLSSQMHHHRSEHWVVVKGTAMVEIDGEPHLLVENQAVDIPKTAKHRLANPGKVSLEIIEIQSGPYLEEDDIVRFDDVYGRVGERAGSGVGKGEKGG